MNRLTSIGRDEDGVSDVFAYNLAGELISAHYRVTGVPFSQDGAGPAEPAPDRPPTLFALADDGDTDPGLDAATSTRTVEYVLDKCGNRTSVTVNSGNPLTYSPDVLNQYSTAASSPVGNGSEHELASYLYVNYNYLGDTYLASVIATTGAQDKYYYGYDALGRCVKHTFNDVVTYYVYDGEEMILERGGPNNDVIANSLYGRGMDELLARNNYGSPQYFLQERLGNTRVVAGGDGTILESYRYDAFGTPTFRYESGDHGDHTLTSINNRFLFAGREYVPKFAFYEYRARAYRPGIGRFMSEDPKGFDAGDYNLYRYCHNDPWDLTDPMGLVWESEGSVRVQNYNDIPNIYVSRDFAPIATGVTLRRLWIDANPVQRADGKYVLDYKDVQIRSKSYIRSENPGVPPQPRSESDVKGTEGHEERQQQIDKQYYDKYNNDIRRDVTSGTYDSEAKAAKALKDKEQAWKDHLEDTRNAEGKKLQEQDSGRLQRLLNF
jgi:RHS repeat-associated protein